MLPSPARLGFLLICSFRLQGGSSKVDILISTPGRLIDHLNGTSNFSLQHLRFLVSHLVFLQAHAVRAYVQVIDEADRLLAQSFQDWLAQVLAATRPPRASDDADSAATGLRSTGAATKEWPHPDSLAPAFLQLTRDVEYVRTDFDEKKESSCQKLLFSATLTRDPAKITALGLRQPKYIVVQSPKTSATSKEEGVLDFVMEKFTMTASLTVRLYMCEAYNALTLLI